MEGLFEELKESLNNKETVVISVNCEIWYDGRAKSYLPTGDRVILIKEDRTLLIHQPTGSNPVNYMKSDSKHSLVEDEGSIILKSENPALKEQLLIKLHELYFVKSKKLQDQSKITLQGTERDMSQMLFDNPHLSGGITGSSPFQKH